MAHGQTPAAGIGAEDMKREFSLTRIAVRYIAILAALIALGACSTLQFSYNNAESLLRYMAWDYFDLDTDQADSLQQRFARLREWHRSSELPSDSREAKTRSLFGAMALLFLPDQRILGIRRRQPDPVNNTKCERGEICKSLHASAMHFRPNPHYRVSGSGDGED